MDWRVEKSGRYDFKVVTNDGDVAVTYNEGDANLISAAPQLYEAVRCVLKALDADTTNAPLKRTEAKLAQAWLRGLCGAKLRAAFEKATGEAA